MFKIIWVDTKKALRNRIKQLSSLVGLQEKQLAEANEWRSRGDVELKAVNESRNLLSKKLHEIERALINANIVCAGTQMNEAKLRSYLAKCRTELAAVKKTGGVVSCRQMRDALNRQSTVNSELRRQLNDGAVKMHELRMHIGSMDKQLTYAEQELAKAVAASNEQIEKLKSVVEFYQKFEQKQSEKIPPLEAEIRRLRCDLLERTSELEKKETAIDSLCAYRDEWRRKYNNSEEELKITLVETEAAIARYMKAESILGDGYLYKPDEPVKQPERYCSSLGRTCYQPGCSDTHCNADLPF